MEKFKVRKKHRKDMCHDKVGVGLCDIITHPIVGSIVNSFRKVYMIIKRKKKKESSV